MDKVKFAQFDVPPLRITVQLRRSNNWVTPSRCWMPGCFSANCVSHISWLPIIQYLRVTEGSWASGRKTSFVYSVVSRLRSKLLRLSFLSCSQ